MSAVPSAVQEDCLRGLERARSVHQAAHASVLSAFDAGTGVEQDGCRSAKSWLAWQTRTTRAAAGAAVGWMRRLRAHPAVAAALKAGTLSVSFARQICDWTDTFPGTARQDADAILLAAAAGGASLADLAALAEQIRAKLARPDIDHGPGGRDDDGFEERRLRLATTLGGAGKLDGDLTGDCAAALQAVLDALGKKAGPEDSRTLPQRHHDALHDACRRLIASGCVPDRAGQPTQIQLHISLEELTRRLNGQPGSGDAGPADITRRLWPRLTDPGPVPSPPLPGSSAAPGEDCDATIMPVVTRRIDHDLIDRLVTRLKSESAGREEARDLIIANAVALLSGPGGFASVLRTGTLPPPAASISLALDVGASTDTIPPHLRRAVILRDQHCAAPGCDQPPSACQIHHLIPRSQGGPTSLDNLGLFCSFHHLIVIHRWGWAITMHPDGTTTMISPDGAREYRSHSPPPATAA